MSSEVVNHIASFVDTSDVLNLAATDTSTRQYLYANACSAAFVQQARAATDPRQIFTLFEEIADLPLHLKGKPLAALAEATRSFNPLQRAPEVMKEVHTARMVLLQASLKLPPQYREAPLIALAGLIGKISPENNWNTDLEVVMPAIREMRPGAQAAAISKLISSAGEFGIDSPEQFRSFFAEIGQLPVRLRCVSLIELARGSLGWASEPKGLRYANALFHAGDNLAPTPRFALFAGLLQVMNDLRLPWAKDFWPAVTEAAQQVPQARKGDAYLKCASLAKTLADPDQRMDATTWVCETTELIPVDKAKVLNSLIDHAAMAREPTRCDLITAIAKGAKDLPWKEQQKIMTALQEIRVGPHDRSREVLQALQAHIEMAMRRDSTQ